MLRAALQGKCVKEAMESEDCLTSAIFSALRFQTMQQFWQPLFHKAQSASFAGLTLSEAFDQAGSDLAGYELHDVHFWPRYQEGEPDLELVFACPKKPDLRILFEIKLYSGKSCRDDNDEQLGRYLNLLARTKDDGRSALIYLTATDPARDLASALLWSDLIHPGEAKHRLFALSWFDLQAVAETSYLSINSTCAADQMRKQLLAEVVLYLAKRDLRHFTNMQLTDFQPFSATPLWRVPLLEKVPNLEYTVCKTLQLH